MSRSKFSGNKPQSNPFAGKNIQLKTGEQTMQPTTQPSFSFLIHKNIFENHQNRMKHRTTAPELSLKYYKLVENNKTKSTPDLNFSSYRTKSLEFTLPQQITPIHTMDKNQRSKS